MQNFRPGNVVAEAPPVQGFELNRRLRLEFDNPVDVGPDVSGAQLVALAQKMKRARSMRWTFITGDLFSEPGWEMLLALFCADATGQRMTISNLCDASCNPDTTALRWIEKLLERGLVKRKKHPLDARVVYIELQPAARTSMRSYLTNAWRTFYA